ncbi:MAG: PDZ domain-containing protein [Acidimicrobiales bacterium]
MTEASREFDESFDDDDEPGRLLPVEDRLWRHPSELSWPPSRSMSAEASEARERWLSRTPTRSGAWSAGLVGAVLAAGVVLVGTHLTLWIGRSPRIASQAAVVSTTVVPSGITALAPPTLDSIAARVHAALTVVQVSKKGGTVSGNGVVISATGKILVPLSLISGASAIAVTTSDGAVYAGRVVGADQETQLAVVSINITKSTSFTALPASSDGTVVPGDWLAVEWSELSGNDRDADSADASIVAIGSVHSAGVTSANGNYQLLNSISMQAREIGLAPAGAVLVDGQARLLGMITGRRGNHVTEIPGELAEQVGRQIIQHGRVIHGWLGIEGRCTCSRSLGASGRDLAVSSHKTRQLVQPGVEIVSIATGKSAAKAGLKVGDVIEAVNGQRVESVQALQQALYVMPPDADVSLTIERGTSITTVEALLQPAA